MSAGDLAVTLAALLCVIGFAALIVVLVRVLDTLKALRLEVESLRRETGPLLAEQRESEARKARKARKREEAERQAAERDREWRAQLHRGIPAGLIPEGVAPAAAMLQAAHDARPRRRSMLEDALDGSGTVFDSYGPDGDE